MPAGSSVTGIVVVVGSSVVVVAGSVVVVAGSVVVVDVESGTVIVVVGGAVVAVVLGAGSVVIVVSGGAATDAGAVVVGRDLEASSSPSARGLRGLVGAVRQDAPAGSQT